MLKKWMNNTHLNKSSVLRKIRAQFVTKKHGFFLNSKNIALECVIFATNGSTKIDSMYKHQENVSFCITIAFLEKSTTSKTHHLRDTLYN